jgi:hypothetical protein
MESAPVSEPPGEKQPGGDGRIPFTFRIGVTGHRQLGDPEELRLQVRAAIKGLLELVEVAAGAGLALVVVSALAEGADRLVAEEVLLAREAPDLKQVLNGSPPPRLEVALPMDREEYAKDFTTEESKEEFCFLLSRARAGDVWEAPVSIERDKAYERAGRYVVDRCDALIAVWDGQESRGRGGTAEIVKYAQEKGVPIAWVHALGGQQVKCVLDNPRAGVVKDAARKLSQYNAAPIDRPKFDQRVRDLRQELMPDVARELPVDPHDLSRETIAGWVFPYFARADILALHYQRRFRRLSVAIFALAALAVAVVAVQTNFWPELNWLAVFEVAFLGALLAILWLSRRRGLYDQWISSRFLAERLRSSYFLALAHTGDQRERSARLAYLSDSSEAWIERALTEVGAQRPELDSGEPPVRALRDYLNHYWIESQINYQNKTSFKQARYEHRLARATALLFLITLAAALVHIFAGAIFSKTGSGFERPGAWEGFLIVVSITVPAFGAAVHGFNAQRQFGLHSDRYRRMAGVLTQVQAEMTAALTLPEVQEVAAATERVMREENSDWFGVMRFHDMELIT